MTQQDRRLKAIDVRFTYQEIIEFAYVVKDLVKPLVEARAKLYVEEANCYLHCFYRIKGLLNKVDENYLQTHKQLLAFYNQDLKLPCERLVWVDRSEIEKEYTEESLF